MTSPIAGVPQGGDCQAAERVRVPAAALQRGGGGGDSSGPPHLLAGRQGGHTHAVIRGLLICC